MSQCKQSWTHRLAATAAAALVILALVGATRALDRLGRQAAPEGAAAHAAGPAAPVPAQRYIVELDDPPLATYEGGTGKLAPTALRRTGGTYLDVRSAAARAYAAHLDRAQEEARARIRALAPGARFDWRYRYVFNGFAVTLDAAQAQRVARLPGVRGVHVEERYQPEMDGSLPLVGAHEAFEEVGGIAEAGLGARIAVIDSGLDSNHPFLRDDGMPPAPTGFPTATMHLRDGTVVPYPQPERYTNNKVIAARIFVAPQSIGSTDIVTALRQLTPLGQGHGLHVTGIAAGRDGDYDMAAYGQSVPLRLSGVAPMATVLNYKANYASSPEYIAMVDQMVLDRVDVFNMSQGHVSWLIDRPEEHPVGRAFDGAFEAGIVPVVSAGNAGANGHTSLSGAFKYSERVLAVGNASSRGSFDVMVTFAGPGAPEAPIAAGARGQYTPEAPISGPLYLAPDGGCAEDPAARGTIAVIDRFGEGTCTYPQRAQFMAESGARAIIYYYNDRLYGGASTAALALPGVGIGRQGGDEVMAWLRGGTAGGSATMDRSVRRGLSELPDVLSAGSSRGPGLDWTLKPDITAPGQGIVSSYYLNVGGQLQPAFAALSGTSMSAPHVAGAAALLRSAHPDWSPADIRSALVNTAARTIAVSATDPDPAAAPPYAGGPGRLDLRHALDPGAVLEPAKAGFGKLAHGDSARLTLTLRSVSEEPETWTLAVDAVTGTAPAVLPADLTLEPGESATITLTLDTATAEQDELWGDLWLARAGTAEDEGPRPALRVAYFAFVERPEERKDVLLVNWTWGDTPDHAGHYTRTLEALGLDYDVWTIAAPQPGAPSAGHVPFKVLQSYDLVLLNQNESIWAFQEALSGSYQYLNALLHGGNMLITGQGQMNWWRFLGKSRMPDSQAYRTFCGDWWPFCFVGPSQNAGCDMCLPRYFAGFTYGVTATLSGRVLQAHELPERPEREVVLPPHADGEEPFAYALDLSTGALAPHGAAGNQYTFASGHVLGPFDPGGATAVEGRDYDNTEHVFDRVRPYARPLWSYSGLLDNGSGSTEVMTRVVGTYVAGKHQPQARIAWNAMFWGFGLEGVGQGADGTVDRERLLGDTFNFLARNLRPDTVEPSWERGVGLRLTFPAVARVPAVREVTVDWGDGGDPEVITLEVPLGADAMVLEHEYEAEGQYEVRLDVFPAANAAPLYGIAGRIEYVSPIRSIYLPSALRQAPLSTDGATEPDRWRR